MPISCSGCGVEVPDNAGFCPGCGRSVTGSFVHGIDVAGEAQPATPPKTPAFDSLTQSVLHPGVRRRVLHAMELVIDNGTANRLKLSSFLDSSNEERPLSPRHYVNLNLWVSTSRVTEWVF